MSMIKDMPGSGQSLVIAPDAPEVDAGQAVILDASWQPPTELNQTALCLRIIDPAGVAVARAPLAVDEGGALAAQISLITRPEAGRTQYRAEVIDEAEPADAPLAATEVEIVTRAHAMQVTVWDEPSTATVDEGFTVHIGVACLSGCDLGGRELQITDASGRVAGVAQTTDQRWPGTTALYSSKATVTAPAQTGLCRFTVTGAADDGMPPHAVGTAGFAVNIMPEGSCDLTIEVLAADSQTPLADARVILHPYRTTSDAAGIARLRVVPGSYRLQLSRKDYMPANEELSVAEDLTLQRLLGAAPAARRPEDDY